MCGVGVVEDVSVCVTDEEIGGGNGVFSVFCAVDECSLDVCELRDVVDGGESKGVVGFCGSDAVSDVVVEVDSAVEVVAGREGPAGAGLVQREGTEVVAVVIGGLEISDVEYFRISISVAIHITKASKQLLLGDGVRGVFCSTGHCGCRAEELWRIVNRVDGEYFASGHLSTIAVINEIAEFNRSVEVFFWRVNPFIEFDCCARRADS